MVLFLKKTYQAFTLHKRYLIGEIMKTSQRYFNLRIVMAMVMAIFI